MCESEQQLLHVLDWKALYGLDNMPPSPLFKTEPSNQGEPVVATPLSPTSAKKNLLAHVLIMP
jgi:hypothetical protein